MDYFYPGYEWTQSALLMLMAMVLYASDITSWLTVTLKAFVEAKKGVCIPCGSKAAASQTKAGFKWEVLVLACYVIINMCFSAFIEMFTNKEGIVDSIAALATVIVVLASHKEIIKFVVRHQFKLGLIESFKRPEGRYYLSTDLETGDFCTPYKDENGEWKQGSETAPILQYAHVLTDANFNEISRFQIFINDEERMDGFKEATRKFHEKTGFMDAWNKANKVSLEDAALMIEEELKRYIPDLDIYKGPKSKVQLNMLGKSVWFDRKFLDAQCPQVTQYFSHQLADVSSVKPMMITKFKQLCKLSSVVSTHDALADCVSAIEEAKVLDHLIGTIPDTASSADVALGLRK